MESPVAIVKQSLNPSSILRFAVLTIVVLAIADALKITDWFLYPVSKAKSKWGTTSTTA